MARLEEFTVATLLSRTQPEGDCLLWQGNCTRGKDPQVRLGGRQVSVRRTVFRLMYGRAARSDFFLSSRHNGEACDGRCVHPDHIVARSHSAAHTGARMPPSHRRNSASARQARSRLTWPLVRELRASSDSNTAWAARLGVTKQYVSLIRQHKTWLDLSSPFAALLDVVGRGRWGGRENA